MPQVRLDRVTVGFPILQVGHRSIKKSVLARATGGAILREASKPPMVRALHDITADFEPGDRVGLIGPNGAGKTTLLCTIAGIYEPMAGRVEAAGTITTMLDFNLGILPDMTGRENIRIRGMYMGLRPARMEELAGEIEAFTELGDYLDLPIRTYSTGMQLRLAFAIATSVRPEILLMDEWMLAGDASFIAKAQARMEEFASSASIFVLASHSESIIAQWCNKAMYLDAGELRSFGPVGDVLKEYREWRAVA